MSDATLKVVRNKNKLTVDAPEKKLIHNGDNYSLIIQKVEKTLNVEKNDKTLVTVAEQGPAGPPGPTGPQGPEGPQGPPGSGSGSGDLNYTHNQILSSATWTITHNLGKHPSVSVIDTGGNNVIGEIDYVSLNSLILNFTAAFSGRAFLN